MPDAPCLLDPGICGLHVVHGAFKSGFQSTSWQLDTILKSLFYLFNESPARRADFIDVTGNSVFPLAFCGTRWVEDCKVAQRAILIWDSVSSYIKKLQIVPKYKQPKCSSYTTICKAVEDPLSLAKLHMFVKVAKVVQPFLEHFQTDMPMSPFLDQEIGKIFLSLMECFIKKSVLSDHVSTKSLIKIDLENTGNFASPKNVTVGLAVKDALLKANCSEEMVKDFKENCIQCYSKALVENKRTFLFR